MGGSVALSVSHAGPVRDSHWNTTIHATPSKTHRRRAQRSRCPHRGRIQRGSRWQPWSSCVCARVKCGGGVRLRKHALNGRNSAFDWSMDDAVLREALDRYVAACTALCHYPCMHTTQHGPRSLPHLCASPARLGCPQISQRTVAKPPWRMVWQRTTAEQLSDPHVSCH